MNSFQNLRTIFRYHKPTPEFVGVCIKLGIDVEKLLNILKDNRFPVGYLPGLAGAYAVNILNSKESEDVKQAKILALIELLSPVINDDLEKDHCLQFGGVLVENASPDQLAFLLPCFAKASYRSQRLAEATFRTLLVGTKPDHEKIKQAFTAYWPIWKEFNMFQPHCSWLILLFIDSEEVLKIAYDAVPDGMKAEIKEYLGKALQQDVIDRVIN